MFNYAHMRKPDKLGSTAYMEPSVKTPDYFNLLIAPDKMRIRGAGWVRSVIAAVFIGLVALFLTAPVSEAPSLYDAPLPMPAGVNELVRPAN